MISDIVQFSDEKGFSFSVTPNETILLTECLDQFVAEVNSGKFVDGVETLMVTGWFQSKGEARRACQNRAITINEIRIESERFLLRAGKTFQIIHGGKNKKYAKVTVAEPNQPRTEPIETTPQTS